MGRQPRETTPGVQTLNLNHTWATAPGNMDDPAYRAERQRFLRSLMDPSNPLQLFLDNEEGDIPTLIPHREPDLSDEDEDDDDVRRRRGIHRNYHTHMDGSLTLFIHLKPTHQFRSSDVQRIRQACSS